jgi:hypothetical protein
MASRSHLDSVKITELADAIAGCVDRLVTGGPCCQPRIPPSPMGC